MHWPPRPPPPGRGSILTLFRTLILGKMTPTGPLGVKSQVLTHISIDPPNTPNRPPRGVFQLYPQSPGYHGLFSLQWKNGGPEWPLNRGSDPPNNFFRLLGSNGAPRWGDVRLSVFFTGKRFAFYKYPMLTVSSRLVWLDEKQTLWKLLFLSFPISFFRIKGATFHFILQASWLTFCKKW